ncbi:MAG: prolyl oligopeptidase family serine peptidase [Bacteroidales bacterium]|nr:prolyl oligopeptidase family serine peptidase [Bacteroidales bacterium]
MIKPQKDTFVVKPKDDSASKVDTIAITGMNYAGPYKTVKPYVTDETDAAGKKYDAQEAALDQSVNMDALKSAPVMHNLPVKSNDLQIHLAGFSIDNSSYAKADLIYEGPEKHQFFLDGKPVSGTSLKLEPGTHQVAVKYLTDTTSCDGLKVSLATSSNITTGAAQDRLYSLDVNTQGLSCNSAALSPSGKYYSLTYTFIRNDGKRDTYSEIHESASGKLIFHNEKPVRWMSDSDSYYFTENGADGERLMRVDVVTNVKSVLAENIPQGPFTISPKEDFAIFMIETEGPKEGDVHQILTPEDRQPGWRNRVHLAKLDFATGNLQRLTFGHRNAWITDISSDGSRILLFTDSYDLSRRPTSMMTLLQMDLETMAVDTLALNDGFVRGASYSADGKKVACIGSPEAFDHIGQNVPEGRTPNMYDIQLYVIDLATKQVKPLTRDFAPSVSDVEWSAFDGKIYLTAEDKDCVNLYRIDPETAKAECLDNQEDDIYSFSLAKGSPQLIYSGQSLCNADRVWLINTKKGKQTLVADVSAQRLDGIKLGEGGEYEFTSSRGDLINGFYVLPPDFDPAKKYPLIVHYYGGCNPSTRYCVGSYSPQYYAAQGYVFYVVNPSGASGFGQEFASRHVNTAGQGVAEDIIEGVQNFCKDHPFVDSKHIGCFSASYGGFMTQLLLAKSDIFATGISHAGISDHTSYWGEGYWGYSYSEVSMANSYPWSHKDLYVDNSPLYMADKIHTPLLFLHGSADTNVPIGESIQMFTALKLLGCETAFVVVDGENHGIREYSKRRQWLRTISAWFAKYLKEDSTWWDELYPPKDL